MYIDFIPGEAVVDLSFSTNISELTCVTSGAPATSVHWESVANKEYQRLQFEVTVDPVRLLYNNKLTLSQTSSSYFECITRGENNTYHATLLNGVGSDQGQCEVL